MGAAATAQTASQVSVAVPSADTRWVVDMVHSQVDFGVRHLVGRVRGTFDKWYAVLATKEGDWKLGTIKVSIQTASLNTGNAYRDEDLRSDRFFAVNRFPRMTFEGTGFAVWAPSAARVDGVRLPPRKIVPSASAGAAVRNASANVRTAVRAVIMVPIII